MPIDIIGNEKVLALIAGLGDLRRDDERVQAPQYAGLYVQELSDTEAKGKSVNMGIFLNNHDMTQLELIELNEEGVALLSEGVQDALEHFSAYVNTKTHMALAASIFERFLII
jgi:hypothetical protein